MFEHTDRSCLKLGQDWNMLILEISDLLVELNVVIDFLHTRENEFEEFCTVFRHASHCAET
jgi:hypothetical protein